MITGTKVEPEVDTKNYPLEAIWYHARSIAGFKMKAEICGHSKEEINEFVKFKTGKELQ